MDELLQTGRVLRETYRIDSLLGAGGMGAVYAATHLRTGRACALKTLRPAPALAAGDVARFRREADALSRLRHPSIVTLLDFDVDEGTPFLVMDLVPGVTLESRLQRDGAVPWTLARRWALELCDALAYAHGAGVVHRDIKPANVLLAPSGAQGERAMLLDFGLAQVQSDEAAPKLTATGALLGTPMYVAPEQARGAPTDARCDVYSLAAVLFEMVTGRAPFSASNVADLIVQVLTAPPPALEALARTPVPRGLDGVLLRALAKDPDARPASARELADRLSSLGAPRTPAQPLPTPVATRGRDRRLTRLVALLALIVPVLLVTSGVLLYVLGIRRSNAAPTAERAAGSNPDSYAPAPPGPGERDPGYFRAVGAMQSQDWRGCIAEIRRVSSSTLTRNVAWSCALNARNYDYADAVCAEARRDEPEGALGSSCEADVAQFRRLMPPR
jgi:serine/threonine-protein kinase